MPHSYKPPLRSHYGASRSSLLSLNSSAVHAPFVAGLPVGSLDAPLQSPLHSLRSFVVPYAPLSAPVVPLRFTRSPPYASQKDCAIQSVSVSPQTPLSRLINQIGGRLLLEGTPPSSKLFRFSDSGNPALNPQLMHIPPFRRFAPPSPLRGELHKDSKATSFAPCSPIMC